jgi:hypothetical protein
MMSKQVKALLTARTLLWTAMLLALVGSLSHTADTFLSINGDWVLSSLQAVAIDAGMIALTLDIMDSHKRNRSTTWSWAGVVVFTFISVFANLRYGLTHVDSIVTRSWLLLLIRDYIEASKPFLMAATLPVLVTYLSKIIGAHIRNDRDAIDRDETRAMRDANRQLSAEIARLKEQLEQVTAPPVPDVDKALAYLRDHPDATQEEVGAHLGKSRSTAGNVLRELIEAGRANKNGHGWEVSG